MITEQPNMVGLDNILQPVYSQYHIAATSIEY